MSRKTKADVFIFHASVCILAFIRLFFSLLLQWNTRWVTNYIQKEIERHASVRKHRNSADNKRAFTQQMPVGKSATHQMTTFCQDNKDRRFLY